jgi:hypothetical protein
MINDTYNCVGCGHPTPKDHGRVFVGPNKAKPDAVYHSRCWYEMKTGKPIDFPEHQLSWRMIELVHLLEVMEDHGEAASSSTILKRVGTNNAEIALIHDSESPLPWRVVQRRHETPDMLAVMLISADYLEARRVYDAAVRAGVQELERQERRGESV